MTQPTDPLIAAASTAGVIGLVTGIARGVIQQKHQGWLGFMRGLVASVLVAVLIGWTLADFGLTEAELTTRLKIGIHYDWANSIDVYSETCSQIVDESVFLNRRNNKQ